MRKTERRVASRHLRSVDNSWLTRASEVGSLLYRAHERSLRAAWQGRWMAAGRKSMRGFAVAGGGTQWSYVWRHAMKEGEAKEEWMTDRRKYFPPPTLLYTQLTNNVTESYSNWLTCSMRGAAQTFGEIIFFLIRYRPEF
jgi:hypothetical protein